MKKIFLSIIAASILGVTSSCSDMLSTDSTRFAGEQDLNQKTDSMFYSLGIMQAMQQLADQHFFQNELRGELVQTTSNATTHLQNLANYSAGTENKYDSVYLYYKVINNCNYYLAHRDTTLATGTQNVVKNEFAAVAAFRAWTYLQLTHQYGNVPYVTAPMLTISDINANTSTTDYREILRQQAEYMQSLKNSFTEDQLTEPSSGQKHTDVVSIGRTNWNSTKSISLRQCYLPFNVVLGDLYLELGEYRQAAKCYFDYLKKNAEQSPKYVAVNNMGQHDNNMFNYGVVYPDDYNSNRDGDLYKNTSDYKKVFDGSYSEEIVSYIPMAVNYTQGAVTRVPEAFGYDYYATSNKAVTSGNINSCPQKEEIQVVPSKDYYTLAKDSAYYYYFTNTQDPDHLTQFLVKRTHAIPDLRMTSVLRSVTKSSTTGNSTELVYVSKPSSGNVILYRKSTVYMHLAEALNRMGHPDLAFAILRDGIHDGISSHCDTIYNEETSKYSKKQYYLTKASYEELTQGATVPFLNSVNRLLFMNDNTSRRFVGIHTHGAGNIIGDLNMVSESQYNYEDIVGERIARNRKDFNIQESGEYTQDEYINAMEDLLAEEYALEFAFEGTRFSDIIRIARHKNMSNCYGTSFGDTWMSNVLKSKGNINTQNCYLPFK